MKRFVVLLLFALSASVLARNANLLILTGANNHDWAATTPVLKKLLEETGRFEVSIVTEPEQLAEALRNDCDVLLSNWNGFGKEKPAPWSDDLKTAYADFVRSGGGHVVVHAGSSSFYDWDDYRAITLASWNVGSTGHREPHEFEVRMNDSDHPVVRSQVNFRTTDELWYKPYVHPDATVAAESFSKHTGNWEPTALVGRFGKGRCFTLLLGHDAGCMQQEGFKNLLTAGTEWAAGNR